MMLEDSEVTGTCVVRLRHHINIPRQVAATIMKEIDPDGVRERRARRLTRRNFISFGPNFTWHIDGKRYILELIQGVSKKW